MKFCTKPELEVLLLLNENIYTDFLKSNDKKVKTFAKKYVTYNKKYYDHSSDFFENYYSGNRIEMLVNNMKEYKNLTFR